MKEGKEVKFNHGYNFKNSFTSRLKEEERVFGENKKHKTVNTKNNLQSTKPHYSFVYSDRLST